MDINKLLDNALCGSALLNNGKKRKSYLAKLLGVDRSLLYKWGNGKSNISEECFNKLETLSELWNDYNKLINSSMRMLSR